MSSAALFSKASFLCCGNIATSATRCAGRVTFFFVHAARSKYRCWVRLCSAAAGVLGQAAEVSEGFAHRHGARAAGGRHSWRTAKVHAKWWIDSCDSTGLGWCKSGILISATEPASKGRDSGWAGAESGGTGGPAAGGGIGSDWSGPVTVSLPRGVLEGADEAAKQVNDSEDPAHKECAL